METVSGASNWKLVFRREGGGVTILRAGTPDVRAVLPERLFGLPVTALGDRALAPERQGDALPPGAEAVLVTCGPAEEDLEADHTYDTAKMEAFQMPAGTAVEVYATTLHYAPCSVEGKGFQVAIVLPKGTNYPLKTAHPRASATSTDNEDHLITAVNKWLIGHAEGGLEPGSFLGLKGRNLDITE